MRKILRENPARFAAKALVALLALVVLCPSLRGQDPLAIRAGKIITGTGEEIVGGTVLVEQGKIVAVGKDVKIPLNARVERHPDGVIVPGFVLAHSQAGLRVSNERLQVVPYISVMDGIDPIRTDFPNLLREGVTTVHVIPGNRTRIGGQGAVLRPHGATVDAMLVKARSAIKISTQPGFGQTRMAHMASLRRDFLALHDYLGGLVPAEPGALLPETGTAKSSLTGLVRPAPDWKAIDYAKIEEKIDAQRRPFVDLVRQKLPAFIYCERASDVLKAFEILDTHGLKATLVLGSDAWRARDLIAARKGLGPVVISPTLELTEKDPLTGKDRKIEVGKELHEAGVVFALETPPARGIFNLSGAYHPWYLIATLIRQGVPREVALRSLTLHPARAIGLEHRLGSLEKGKDANFTIFTGDLFDVRTWVDRVYIEGNEVYRRDRDRELQELLKDTNKGF